MRSNYRRLGDYIQEVKIRNREEKAENLLGVNIDKFFMPSVANVVGTDLSVYKLVRKKQFACNRMHVGRDYRLPIAMSKIDEEFMVSPAYDVFEIIDTEVLNPEFLMLWFSRKEFDRNAWFYTDADVRGGLPWKSFCDMQLPIPHPDKQREIVKEYNTIQNRIELNKKIIQKLEDTAQAIYREWFVERVDLENLPEGWRVGAIVDVAEFLSRGITPNYSENAGVAILNQKCIRNNSISLEFSRKHNEEIKKIPNEKYLKQYDTLINSTGDGTLGRVGVVKEVPFPLTVDSHITILRTNNGNNPLYVWGNLSGRSDEIANLAEGSTGQTELSRSMFSELPILIPDKSTQNNFANIITKGIKYSYLLEQENQNLTELKNLLLSNLATVEN